MTNGERKRLGSPVASRYRLLYPRPQRRFRSYNAQKLELYSEVSVSSEGYNRCHGQSPGDMTPQGLGPTTLTRLGV
jgi:hypothetical protein